MAVESDGFYAVSGDRALVEAWHALALATVDTNQQAEQTTVMPTLWAFIAAHGLSRRTVVADADAVSEANKKAIEQAALNFILGAKAPKVP